MPLCKQGRLHPQVLGDMVTVNKEAINVTDLFTCVVVHRVTCILIINHGKQVAAFHTSLLRSFLASYSKPQVRCGFPNPSVGIAFFQAVILDIARCHAPLPCVPQLSTRFLYGYFDNDMSTWGNYSIKLLILRSDSAEQCCDPKHPAQQELRLPL